MGSQIQPLPPETICRILCFLSPLDVVRLRAVSKHFRDLANDSEVWKTLYATASIPLLPGPYPHQSTQFLERVLIKSENLAQTWTTRPIRVQELACIETTTQAGLGGLAVRSGRWLVSYAERSGKFILHDTDCQKLSQHVLWERQSLSSICSWDACWIMSPIGDILYILYPEQATNELDVSWMLLEFTMDEVSGKMTRCISCGCTRPTQCLLSGNVKGPFLHICPQNIVFDTRTGLLYELPAFSTAIETMMNLPNFLEYANPDSVLLATTHFITMRYIRSETSTTGTMTLLQAFVIPIDPSPMENGTRVLRLTHEGVIDNSLASASLVRNSVVTSSTGSTTLRLLHNIKEGTQLRFVCIDLTLPQPHTGISHILSEIHDIFTIDNTARNCFIDASTDGHIRGFFQMDMGPHVETNKHRYMAMKFVLDATKSECTAVLGQPAPFEIWSRWANARPMPTFVFDGLGGKLCYSVPRQRVTILGIR